MDGDRSYASSITADTAAMDTGPAVPARTSNQRGPWREVSAASAAFFRIAFGLGMVVNALLYIPRQVGEFYVDPSFHFSYAWFDWIEPAPELGMYAVYAGLVLCGAAIALGLWYRWAVGVFFVLTTYVFLLDSTHYQNHEYLISLLAFLMLLMPLDRYWSLDARRRPALARATVPVWVIWMLRFQIGVPYFFGGVAKLNGDWLRGEPLRRWLANRTDIEPIRSMLTDPSVVWMMNHGALMLDLLAVPLLLWRRTRLATFLVLVAFHLLNVWLFGLYIFPWLMIAATTVFFDPDWPRALATRARAFTTRTRAGLASVTADDDGALAPEPVRSPPDRPPRRGRLLMAFLAAWVVVQLVVPLRHLAIAGHPNWTEEGHRFAWHMMLRSKSGSVTYEVETESGVVLVDPRDHLTDRQYAGLVGHPQRLVQFAHHLSALHGGAEVRAKTDVSLNGRDRQPIVDPTADLAAVPTWWFGRQDVILPLTQPLR
jgi:uncharacterized membrane protein YphA (DoxX/SURF4 family)